MTTKISADNIQPATLASIGGGPKISQIIICDSSYTNLDDTAIVLSGGYIKIIGSGFKTGATVTVNKTAATSVTFISATELRAQVSAQVAGTYIVYVVNSDSSVALRVNGLTYSSEPTWVSGSALDGASGTAISIQLAATGAATFALQAGSTLPTGLTLSSGGLLSGTVTVASETLYNFTIVATDAELQDSPRSFSVTITVGDTYFNSTTLLLPGSANTFVKDASTNNFPVTVVGDTKPNNFNPYLTGWSNFFDGTGDFLTVAESAGTNNDATVECWIYPITQVYVGDAFIVNNTGNSIGAWAISIHSTTRLISVWSDSFGSLRFTSTAAANLNTWTHVALVRISGILYLYINGVRQTGSYTTGTTFGQGTTIHIGQYSAGGQAYTGYISNLRAVYGTAVYTANFTPPTQPLSAITGTSLLTCTDNRFVDDSANNFAITRNGDVKIQSFSPFVETATTRGSAYFDGTGDYLTVPGSAAFEFGTGAYTIEGWVNVPVGTNNKQVISTTNLLLGTGGFSGSTIGALRYNDGASTFVGNATYLLATGNWTHFAVVRENTSTNGFKMYVNGNLVLVGTSNRSHTGNSIMYIGSVNTTADFLPGYISNLRIVKGTAIYTTASTTIGDQIFTPPTSPLTAITNTSLLTLQNNTPQTNNTFLDSSSNNLLVTRAGNATQGTFSPYSPSGWSSYFDGTGDFLTVGSSTNLALGADNWTVEAWIYPTSVAIGQNIIIDWRSSNNGLPVLYMVNNQVLWRESSATKITSSATLNANTWYHVAVVKVSTTTTMYINGVSVGSYTDTTNYVNADLKVGKAWDTNYWNGYISNLRIVRGTAVYTANFTPSTQPLTAIAGTSLLTCADNRFIDESPNNFAITRNGDTRVTNLSPFKAQVQTPQTYSAYFDGSNDYLSIANTSLVLNNSAFTISFWFYPMTSSVIGLFDSGPNQLSVFRNYPANTIQDQDGGSVAFTANTAQWNWMSIVGTGSTFTVYLNGSSVGSASYASLFEYSFTLGTINNGTAGSFNGYISNFRIKNIASVDAVPTAPLTAVTGTTFLTCQSATFVDNSTNRFVITAVGNSQPSTVNPFGSAFANSTGYTAAEYGGSMYFDGTGDSLTVSTLTSGTALAGTNWTIECWFYADATKAFAQIMGNRSTASGTTSYAPILVAYESGTIKFYSSSNGTSWNLANAATIGTVALQSWNHIAIVRNGINLDGYLNGVKVSISTALSGISYTSTNLFYASGATDPFQGYISNMRLITGNALYTSSFVPPLAPVLPVQNTVLLLNGTSAAITDATTKNDLETVGNAIVSTAVSKFGGSSMYFTGGGASYVQTPVDQPAFGFGTGDFTVELWINPTAGVSYIFFDTRRQNESRINLGLTTNSAGIQVSVGSTSIIAVTSGITPGAWNHIAVTRASGSLRLFINGTQAGATTSMTTDLGVVGSPCLATAGDARGNAAYGYTGYIQDVRVTRGIARYTANFTAPTTAFNTK